MIDLIILDLYGTLAIANEYDNTPRDGIMEFLEANNRCKLALATDDPSRESIDAILSYQDIMDRFNRIYTGKDLIDVKGYRGRRKDLIRICADLHVDAGSAIFISDGNEDKSDARRDYIKFIHVPKYIQTDEPFSFSRIDLSRRLPEYRDMRDINSI